MRITKVEPTELFTGTAGRPLQVVRVTLANDDSAAAQEDAGRVVAVRIEGPTVGTPRPTMVASPAPGREHTVEVGVELAAPVTEGSGRRATAIAEYAGYAAGQARPDAVPRPAGQRAAEAAAEIIAAVPGWTMWMVSHFHYDPVWWNTQAQFTESRLLLPDENGKLPEFRTAFELVGLHLDMAREDPDYKFVLAEIDYLKPYLDTHPERRPELKRLVTEGRIEIVGGNYNEPNTNLTCAESTIRNAIYGIGFQRDVLGGDPATAWMLDVFGHDPSYPSLMASAGLTSSAWARGPFHQWGPRGTVGDNTRMQFPSEFEWMSPDGNGLLTAYMPNHYGAGWVMQSQGSLAAAEQAAYDQFRLLKPVAATRNVLLPVGADHVVPCRWAAPIHRDWNERYVWPRFVTALPREFFAAVRADAARRDIVFTTQTRDMNPVYPGKDVSYIDTKQGQRAAETAVMDAERLATLAWLHGAAYPDAALDKAWRQMVYGAHHDAITGTESDQVYLDLLGGWREAYERGAGARRAAISYLAGMVNTADTLPSARRHAPAPADGRRPPDRAVVVFNTLAGARAGLVTITLRCPRPGTGGLELRDGDGVRLPALAENPRCHPDGTLAEVTLTFRAIDVPGLGYRTYWAHAADHTAAATASGAWSTVEGTAIESAVYRLEADPRRGGALTRVVDKRTGTDLVAAGTVANELVIQDEYDYHPRWNEGPWLLMPKGPGTGSAAVAAQVRAQRCPIGTRLVSSWAMDGLRVTQETLLWDGARQVEFRTHVDGSIGHDRLLRVRFPLNVPGGLPVYETAAAAIGRPFGPVDTDVGKHWFTLDNPAYTWFGLGSAVRVIVRESGGGMHTVAIGVAEVITPGRLGTISVRNGCRETTRSLIAALAQQGVTATCAVADGPRYGAIDLDSNLPDVRIALGGPEMNGFTAEVLAAADPAYGRELARRLAAEGVAAVWVPAAQTRAAAFVPGADVRGARDLPVLIVAGTDLAEAVIQVTASLAAAEVHAVTPASVPAGPPAARQGRDRPARDRPARDRPARDRLTGTPPLATWSAALLNRGTPGSVVTTDGSLNISLMRSCSGWPSGVWIDQPKRTAPDGSSFSWQHWSHTFEYALVSSGPGESDWRDAGFVAAGQAYNHPLLGCETDIRGGSLPAAASLFPIEVADPGSSGTGGAGAVVLTALKPHGNPAAAGSPGRPRRGRARPLTVRLREPAGRPVRVRLRPPGGLGSGAQPTARVTDLLEERDGDPLDVADGNAVIASLPPAATVTLAVPAFGEKLAATAAEPAVSATPTEAPADAGTEPAQPVFTRYWLHGKGPAPAGNLPVAVHVSPGRAAMPLAGGTGAAGSFDAGAVHLRVTVCAGRSPAAGSVELDVPEGLTADIGPPAGQEPPAARRSGSTQPPAVPHAGASAGSPAGPSAGSPAGPSAVAHAEPAVVPYALPYFLRADGYVTWDVTVRATGPTVPPGRYFVAARINDVAGPTDGTGATDGARQILEDVATIAVGENAVPPRDTPLDVLLPLLEADEQATAAELGVTWPEDGITLVPGERADLAVRLVNHARSQIRGEAQLVSPFGTWDAISPWTRGFTIEPGAAVTVRYGVLAPAAGALARPGAQWWALVKVCYFGRVRYTGAIRVSIAA
jgi:alpha-mannosidase